MTLFVDTSNHALRRVVWNSKLPLEPIPSKYLDRVPPARREELRTALEARRSVEDEDTVDIEPTLDGPIEGTAFELVPPRAPQKH